MDRPRLYLIACLVALFVEATIIISRAPYPCVLCHKPLTAATRLRDFDLCVACGDKLTVEIARRLGGSDEKDRRRGAVRLHERTPYVPPYPVDPTDPAVTIVFEHGDVTFELFQKQAPVSTENFLAYVRAGKYDNTIVHRVESFLIVAGRFTGGYGTPLQVISPFPAIQNEATNGRENRVGTIALPRLNENPHSATSDFHVNLLDNKHLNYRGATPEEYGYAVFGQVLTGYPVIEVMKDEGTLGDNKPSWAYKGLETMPRERLGILRAIEHPRVPDDAIAALTSKAGVAFVGSGGSSIYGGR